jgi:hypothetical protein
MDSPAASFIPEVTAPVSQQEPTDIPVLEAGFVELLATWLENQTVQHKLSLAGGISDSLPGEGSLPENVLQGVEVLERLIASYPLVAHLSPEGLEPSSRIGAAPPIFIK